MKRIVLNLTLMTFMALVLIPATGYAEAQSGEFSLWEDEPVNRTVGLEEAVGLAMRGNPRLRAMGNAYEASLSGVGIARSNWYPKLTLEERYMKTDNPTYAFMSKLNQERFDLMEFMMEDPNDPDEIEDWQTSISIEQLLYSRRASVGVDMARSESEAVGLDLRREKERVVLSVIQAYAGVVTAHEYVRAAEQGLDDARENSRIAKARYDTGVGLYSDVLRTDVFVKEAEERLVRARKNLSVARRALGLMMGIEEPVDARDDLKLGEAGPIEQYLQAVTGRSDIKAMNARTENARNMVKMANAKYLPDFGVGGSYQYNDHEEAFGDEGKSYQVMAFMRWNLFDGSLREHERRQASYQVRAANEYLDGMKKEAVFRVHEAYLGLREAQASLDLARSKEELAQEGKRLVGERYENALATVVELLDAQSALDASRADVVEKTGKYVVALAELKFQSGLILNDFDIRKEE
jgi:outer membrane protein TolC